jgi:hypothetical protein
VASLPETHVVCPEEQLFEHVVEHDAPGDMPQHDCGLWHIEMEATYGQPSMSTAHVASVCPSWQLVPACAQIDETHVHASPLSVALHVWWGPQAFEQGPPSAPVSARLAMASPALESLAPVSPCGFVESTRASESDWSVASFGAPSIIVSTIAFASEPAVVSSPEPVAVFSGSASAAGANA